MEQWLDAAQQVPCIRRGSSAKAAGVPARTPSLVSDGMQLTDMASHARRSARRWSSGWMPPAGACPQRRSR